jgi:hypothetical protein
MMDQNTDLELYPLATTKPIERFLVKVLYLTVVFGLVAFLLWKLQKPTVDWFCIAFSVVYIALGLWNLNKALSTVVVTKQGIQARTWMTWMKPRMWAIAWDEIESASWAAAHLPKLEHARKQEALASKGSGYVVANTELMIRVRSGKIFLLDLAGYCESHEAVNLKATAKVIRNRALNPFAKWLKADDEIVPIQSTEALLAKFPLTKVFAAKGLYPTETLPTRSFQSTEDLFRNATWKACFLACVAVALYLIVELALGQYRYASANAPNEFLWAALFPVAIFAILWRGKAGIAESVLLGFLW